MTSSALPDRPAAQRVDLGSAVPLALMALAFVALFVRPATLLASDWWNDPEAGHGLLLAPAALWLAWKQGLIQYRAPQPVLGMVILIAAVFFRLAAELAAELFVMRGSMIVALVGVTTFYLGFRQVLAWWLPFLLLGLAVPLPELIRSAIALPLQYQASQLGAALLEWRHVPVQLAGNIIQLPGHKLFVTEACSGLRSLTALLSIGVLMGGLWLRYPVMRVLLIALAIPIAVLINGVRVFLTGFLVFFVDPKLGEGFMHVTEGWLLFVVSLVLVGGVAWVLTALEALIRKPKAGHVTLD